MFSEEIKKELHKILLKIQSEIPLSVEEIHLEHPANLVHGDYSTNVALQVFKIVPASIPGGKLHTVAVCAHDPLDFAKKIKEIWEFSGLPDFIEKIEVAGPGFLNIWLNFAALSTSINSVLEVGDRYGSLDLLKGKTMLLEHTSPNTNKSLHVGHVRNNTTGMAIARILTFAGAKVYKDCLFNDRGIHICKAMWGYLNEILNFKFDLPALPGKAWRAGILNWRERLDYWFEHQDDWPTPQSKKIKSDKFVGSFYGLGVKAEGEEKNKGEMEEILIAWEKEDPKVRHLWEKLNSWVYQGFEETFKRLGSSYDHVWYESKFYKEAKQMAAEGLKKGVLKKLPDGAILTNLESLGLTDTIVQRSDGTSMYFTQDIYLTKLKTEKFVADKYIWLVGPEQQLHLKQVFAVVEQMGIGSREKFLHLWYGYVFLKGKGKMSSRAGTVVSADDLMNEAKTYAMELVHETAEVTDQKEKEVIAEAVGIGAVKYTLLKLKRTLDIDFDWRETVSLKGNSGPYIQYTFARTQSVLQKKTNLKFEILNFKSNPNFKLSNEEQVLLRTIYRFPEIVGEAAKTYSPNLICNFLFDLSQKFNLFYDKERILGSENEGFRLNLTAAVGQVIKTGLNLLGIEALAQM